VDAPGVFLWGVRSKGGSLKRNFGSSLTLYIQNRSPSPDKERNWLAAPDDRICMAMRLCWPRDTPPSSCRSARGRGSRRGEVVVRGRGFEWIVEAG